MTKELSHLMERFPVPPQWSAPEVFRESLEFGKNKLELVGLLSRHQEGADVAYGAAAEIDFIPWGRAYFELLERVCTYDAKSQRQSYRALKTVPISEWDHTTVFPVADEPQQWKYSLSNGVALYPKLWGAAFRAGFELIERDVLLRSWRRELQPRPVTEIDFGPVVKNILERDYDLKVFEITAKPHQYKKKVSVVVVAGFPKHPSVPLLYGFGAACHLQDAFNHAVKEVLQRFGFLLGESLPTEEPPFSPTPDFHQDYFLLPQNQFKIRNWLEASENEGFPDQSVSLPQVKSKILWFDLTPPSLRNKVYIIRAVGFEGILPLYFGAKKFDSSHPLTGVQAEELIIHPFT